MARKVRSISHFPSSFELMSAYFASSIEQKPVSGKFRKAQLQAKRATKQANQQPVPFPETSSSSPSCTRFPSSLTTNTFSSFFLLRFPSQPSSPA